LGWYDGADHIWRAMNAQELQAWGSGNNTASMCILQRGLFSAVSNLKKRELVGLLTPQL